MSPHQADPPTMDDTRSAKSACDNCVHACRGPCERIRPGVQPYYAAYQLSGDTERYVIWNHRQWRDWRQERGRRDDTILSHQDHLDFHDWLMARWGVPEAWWGPPVERRPA